MENYNKEVFKKKSNYSWKIFSILLIIINLFYLSIYIIALRFIIQMLVLSPLLLPLAIVDFIAIRSYVKKQSPIKKQPPPWKALFILLLAFNIIFFLLAKWELSQSWGGLAAIVIIPIALILLLFDSIMMLSYIYIHLSDSKAKVIFYTVLVSITLGILALSITSYSSP